MATKEYPDAPRVAVGAVVPLPKSLTPGLRFSVKKILRLGIILLGIRLTIFDVFKLGAFGIPIVGLCIIGGLILVGTVASGVARRYRQFSDVVSALLLIAMALCFCTQFPACEFPDRKMPI